MQTSSLLSLKKLFFWSMLIVFFLFTIPFSLASNLNGAVLGMYGDSLKLSTDSYTPNSNIWIGYGDSNNGKTMSKEYLYMNSGKFQFMNGNVGIGTQNPADKLDIYGWMRVLSDTNPIRFTNKWSAFPDSVTNQAEISNDTNGYKTLMIVGNKSAGMGRRVSVWDRFEVNGISTVTDKLGVGTATPTEKLDIYGWMRVLSDTNPIRFTNKWSAFPDSVTNQAEISNDTNGYKTLMIVGNKSAGMGRRVSVWDRFEVNGISTVTDKLGVGTATPTEKLDVKGNIQISNANIPMGFTTEVLGDTPLLNMDINFREINKNNSFRGAVFRIDTRDNSPLFQWLTRSAKSSQENIAMALTEKGNLGINTNNPEAQLHVSTIGLSDNDVGFRMGGNGKFVIDAPGIIGGRVSVLKNGNVGIGTTNPLFKTHIIAPGGFGPEDTNGISLAGNVPLVVQSNSTAFGVLNAAGRQAFALNIDGDTSKTNVRGVPTLYDKFDGTWHPSISMNNGKVGIGTTNPTEKLEVAGNIKSSGTICDKNGCIGTNISLQKNANLSSTAGDNFTLRTETNTPNPNIWIGYGDGKGGRDSSKEYILMNGRKFQIMNSNVGIGTDNPKSNLQIGGVSGLFDYNSGFNLLGNLYFSNGWKYTTSNYGTAIQLDNTQGNINLQTADKGTSDNNASPISRMLIKNNGNVGIGTTDPQAKLDVDGERTYLGSSTSPRITILNGWNGHGAFVVNSKNPYDDNSKSGVRFNDSLPAWQMELDTRSSHDRFGLVRAAPGKNWEYIMLVKGNGNVGIGTTDPTEKLTVAGSVRLGSDSSQVFIGGNRSGAFLRLNDDSWLSDSQNGWINVRNGADTDFGSWQFGNIRTTRDTHLAVNSGNVGVGTTDPKVKLDVSGDIKSSGTICDKNGCIGSTNNSANNVIKVLPDGNICLGKCD